MERSLHPELAKRMVDNAPNGRSRINQMGAMTLVQNTRRGCGKHTPRERQQKDITILDVYRNAAGVKIVASDWADYLHMAKFNGRGGDCQCIVGAETGPTVKVAASGTAAHPY